MIPNEAFVSKSKGARRAIGAYAMAVQAHGKILVDGNCTTLGGGGIGTSTTNNIARLNQPTF